MKTLHLFRSEPDETTRQLITLGFSQQDNQEVHLHGSEDEIDYAVLVEMIFESDQIISWW